MSKLTQKFFRKLHNALMANEEYKSGYDYAKNHKLWDSMSVDELLVAVRVYYKMGFDGNRNAAGIAFALREVIWQRLSREQVA